MRVTHVDLDLDVLFDRKVLKGTVTLTVERARPEAGALILDARALDIAKAEDSSDGNSWAETKFELGPPDKILGAALIVLLHPKADRVRLTYQTRPEASGLQWLEPSMTAGKSRPYLFSQSEAIHARSWIPLQDSPQVRVTYKATIHTAPGVLAVMSARNDPNAKRKGLFTFDMPEAVPSYLIALAVGDLAFQATGPRTGVYAEKSVVKAAAAEFADTESMIEIAEQLFGPYRWDRYDILVLPRSFPTGGMENPRLSFITPTVIAGDKSLVSVIAHELAHSWSGNLVSNATWRDLWLNEGFTDFLESRIVNAVYGEKREMMERVLGLRSLDADLAKLKPADQVLAIDLRGRNPDEVFSQVPYEKGRLLLTFLDARFGREHFDAFLRGYFDHFAFQSITTEQFLGYLQANLLDRFPGIVSRDQVMAWVTGPGIPADAVLPVTAEFAAVDAARAAWLAGTLPMKALQGQSAGWVAQQWLHFLGNMPATLTTAQMASLDRTFALSRSGNAEIAHEWFLLVINNRFQPAYVRLEEYLRTTGRRKLITPLYEALMKTPAGGAQAKRVYALARPGYHPETVAALDAIVNPTSEEADE